MRMKKLTAWTLTAAMLSSMLPAPVFAAEANDHQIPEVLTQTVNAQVSPEFQEISNDELFAGYVDSVLYGYEIATFGTAGRDRLLTTDAERGIYDLLKEKIEAMVRVDESGSLNNNRSTIISVLGAKHLKTTWTASEMKTFDYSLNAALDAQFNYSNIISALLYDCPYELYWFDKAAGYGMVPDGGANSAQNGYELTQLDFKFKVASAYQDQDSEVADKLYTVDNEMIDSAYSAKSVAEGVVNNVARYAKNDFDKLVAYKQYICEAVKYNSTAATPGYVQNNGYGDPWQLIYVFDAGPDVEENDTDVVCEGYAKAFQYLCDLSEIPCISVTGDMNDGGHMWNLASPDEGKNYYLVDVTNCEDDDPTDNKFSVGYPDKLFLRSVALDEAKSQTYSDVSNIKYEYDAESLALMNGLTLAEADYTLNYLIYPNIYTGNSSGELTFTVNGNTVKRAKVGDVVTVTCEPAEGYEFSSLLYNPLYGEVTSPDTQTATFTMPAGTVFVSAGFVGHTHDFVYTIDEDETEEYSAIINATCEGCPDSSNTGSVTLSVGEGTKVYKEGEAFEATVTTEGILANEDIKVVYTATGEDSKLTEGKAINAGTYTASITLVDKDGKESTVIESFTITKAVPTYAIPKGLTATYGDTLASVTFAEGSGFAWKDENAATTLVGNVGEQSFTATYTPTNTNYEAVEVQVPVTVEAKEITFTIGDAAIPSEVVYTSAGDHSLTITDGITFTGLVGEDMEDFSDYTATLTYTLPAKDQMKFTDGKAEVDGTVTVTLSEKSNYKLEASESKVAVTIVDHEHTWNFTDDENVNDATITAKCINTEGCPLNNANITLTLEDPSDLVYDGTAKTVEVKQTVNDEPVTAFTKEQLNVFYSGDNKNVSEAGCTATLTMGVGESAKTATLNFKITAKEINADDVTISEDVTYDGQAHEPEVTIDGLEKGKDYAVAYERNDNTDEDKKFINAGTITVKVTGIGNYTTATDDNADAAIEKTFTIAQKNISDDDVAVELDKASVTYTGVAQQLTVTVKVNGTAIESTNYTVTYGAGEMINVGTYTVTVTGTGNYTDEVELPFEITAKEIAEGDVTIPEDVTYDGQAHEPKVTTNLDENDYEVTYERNGATTTDFTSAGAITVKVTGKNNYTGVITKEFKIAQKSISADDVELDAAEVTYNGSEQKPEVIINGLEKDKDYTVAYSATEVKDAGTYTVTVTGKDNYTGKVELTFEINAKALTISGAVITDLVFIKDATAPYNLNVKSVTFKDSDGTEVTLAAADYTATAVLTGDYAIADGVAATVTVELNNQNYTLDNTTFAEATVNIVEHTHAWTYTVSDAAITATCGNAETCPNKTVTLTLVAPEDLTFSNSPKEVTVQQTSNDQSVSVFTDVPEVEYGESGNTNVGKHTATLTMGEGESAKTATLTFVITAKALTDSNVTISEDVTYTGDNQTPTVTVKDGEKTLVADTDYTVTYQLDGKKVTKMTNAGAYTIVVTGKGNYTTVTADANDADAIVKTFTIAKADQDAPTGLKATAETLLGQANGKITGLSSKMEYLAPGATEYAEITGKKLENLATGTYKVRYKETENYKPGAAEDVTIEAGKPITVTFDANGQEFATDSGFITGVDGLSYGDILSNVEDFTNLGTPKAKDDDFAFVGWYADKNYKDVWNVKVDTLTKENVTLYAKWEQVRFDVQVEITDFASGKVTAQFMRGSESIGDTKESETGSFTFENVNIGSYNLVVTYEGGTKTVLVMVDDNETVKLTLPIAGVKSELKVTSDANTPDVMVGGLDTEAAGLKTGEVSKVTVTMDVVGKTEDTLKASATQVLTAIKQAITGKDDTTADTSLTEKVEYMNIDIKQKVDSNAEQKITETSNVIEILIPLNGRYNVKIIRHHGEGDAAKVEKFTQGNSNTKTDGYFYVDKAEGYIHIFTKKFSTYAVASTENCKITFDLNGGKENEDNYKPVTIQDGDLITLPVAPTRDGYTFNGWYIGSTKVTEETKFTEDTTITAKWTKNASSSDTPNNDTNNDYWGGNYYTPSTPTYPVSTPTYVENGSVSGNFKNATQGSTVTLTVTPDEGYELVSLIVTDKNGNELTLTAKGDGKFSFIMPGSKVDIKATFEEIAVEPEAPVNPFYDVAEGDYYYDAVLWANENGITSGVGNGLFAPHATCTRAQMVTFLWNAAGCPNVSADYGTFTDVTANDYYYKAVLWANANNITSGTGNGAFSPNQICTRAQMATFLYKFAEGQAEGTYNPFVDVTASDYYAQPVQWAVENGITAGTSANTFGPNDPCTRAQMVTFLYRLLAE